MDKPLYKYMNKNLCKICGSEHLNPYSLGGWDYLSCGDCGIVYLREIPSAEQLDEFYKKNYKITADNYAESEYRRIFRIPEQIELISDIAVLKDKPAKLLDIGCDKGYFIDEARRYGYDVSGVEPSLSARQYCEKLKLECVDDLSKITEKQDLAVMWHSLEHHIDPIVTLNEVYKILNTNGFILIRVPDFQCLYRKILGKSWIWFQPDRHYWHFSQKSISVLLEKAGFELVKVESRKPNTRLTKKMYKIAIVTFQKYFDYNQTLKKAIGRIYEDLTAVEVFAVGRKK